jgi:hypothetical protein
MSFRSTYAGCSIRVDGLPIGASRFVVQASIAYDRRLNAKERARLAPGARMKLVLAVLGEAERARLIGVDNVRIAVLGDAALDRLFRSWSSRPGAEPARAVAPRAPQPSAGAEL